EGRPHGLREVLGVVLPAHGFGEPAADDAEHGLTVALVQDSRRLLVAGTHLLHQDSKFIGGPCPVAGLQRAARASAGPYLRTTRRVSCASGLAGRSGSASPAGCCP